MNQEACDLECGAIVAGLAPSVDQWPDRRPVAAPEIRRIASAVFCSVGIDPSIIAFAVRRTAVHLGLREDDVDVAVTVALLTDADRVKDELGALDAP